MPSEQCQSMNPLGTRCTMTTAPGSKFCRFHSHEGAPSIGGSEPNPKASAFPAPNGNPADSPRRHGDTEFSDTEVLSGKTAGRTPPTPPDILSDSVSPCLRGESAGTPTEGMEWLQALLQQAMTEVMAGEGTPLQKASAIARLGNLYLKAHGAAELKQTNKELRRQVAEMEKRLTAAEARLATSEAAPVTEATSTAKQVGTIPPPARIEGSRCANHLEPGTKSYVPEERGVMPLSDVAPGARSR